MVEGLVIGARLLQLALSLAGALVVALGVASTGRTECGNARWWYPDDSDPEIHQHLGRSRLMGHECVVEQDAPGGCDVLIQFGERLLDYMILQYEHARASDSRTHQGQSLFWLTTALRYGGVLRSPTVIRYVRDHSEAIEAPPPLVNPVLWQSRFDRLLQEPELQS